MLGEGVEEREDHAQDTVRCITGFRSRPLWGGEASHM